MAGQRRAILQRRFESSSGAVMRRTAITDNLFRKCKTTSAYLLFVPAKSRMAAKLNGVMHFPAHLPIHRRR